MFYMEKENCMKFYQEKVSEGLIQFELYRQCLNNGIFAYPEYKCRINGKRFRFDLIPEFIVAQQNVLTELW